MLDPGLGLRRAQKSKASADLSLQPMLILLIATRPTIREHFVDLAPSEVSLDLEYRY